MGNYQIKNTEMKRILIIAICLMALTFTSQAQVKFGPMATLFFNGTSFGIGAKAHTEFSDDIDGQASFTYFLESGTFWSLDADVLYKGLDIGDVEDFSIVPFGGLNIFQSPSFTFQNIRTGGTTIGLNLGVSAKKSISDNMLLFIEPKVILGGAGTFAVTGGVFF